MASAVTNPEEQIDGGLTFLRPLPSAVPVLAEEAEAEVTQITRVTGPSPSQLIQQLFPQSADREDASQASVTGLELGHFVIEERIGRGGMGAVFRAIDRGLDRVVALKVLSPEQSADAASVQRFHNEGRAAAQLDHNNIARVFYIGRDRGIHFIAFEFVVGTTIRDLIVQRGSLSVGDAVNYTLQIADALRHTAAAQVVHRDIKPSNIIITPSGRAKLVDLGLARQSQGKGDELTVAGTALGTFDYIAPEQAIDARNVDVRSDIYSLGCTLYHMLTGEPPYPRGSMFEKVMNHHRASPPCPSQKNSAVPRELGAIVQKMMATNPDERFSTPDQLCQELMAFGTGMGLRPVSLESPAWAPQLVYPLPRSQWDGIQTWLIVAVILIGAVIAVDQIPWDGEPSAPVAAQSPQSWQLSPTSADQTDGGQLGTQGSVPTLPQTPAETTAKPVSPPTAGAGPLASAAGLTGSGKGVESFSTSNIPELPPPPEGFGPPEPEMQGSGADPGELLNNLKWSSLASTINKLSNGVGGLVKPPMESPGPATAGQQETSGGAAVQMTDSPTATLPTESPGARPVPPPLTTEPFRVITSTGVGATYQTLAEACFAAEDGAIIELHFDGRLTRQQPPLRITRKRLTLRPAEGFRPILAFALDSSVSPSGNSASMITLGGSALEIYNVDIEMRVDPRTVVDHWSLFSCNGVSELEVVGASLTLINPDKLPASFIEIPLRDGGTDSMPDKMYRDPLNMRLLNCIIRGQGHLVSHENTEPMRLQLMNVAAAISGAALRLSGEDVFSMTMREEEVIDDVEMQHVTLVSEQGLLSADSGDHGQFLPVRFNVRDSVFSVLTPDQPLISLTGHEEFDELQSRVTWANNRDSNFFELTGPMWRVLSPLSSFNPRQDYSFADWVDYWGQSGDRQVLTGLLRNPRPEMGERIHHFDWSDFALRPSTVVNNPAIGAASDRRDSGVDWTQNQLPSRFPTLLSTDR